MDPFFLTVVAHREPFVAKSTFPALVKPFTIASLVGKPGWGYMVSAPGSHLKLAE